MEDPTASKLSFEHNALLLVKRELANVFATQLERRCQKTQKLLKQEKERLARLCGQQHLTKQQIEFFTQETQRAI